MGTKKPCYTLTDTLSKAISGGPRLQQGGKISQNPTSRSKMTASLEQDRDNKQEENWRDCGFAPRFREGDREWKKTERRQEDDRGKNWRLHSNNEKEIKGWKSKGDTFPRIRKDKADYAAEMAAERRERRQRDRPRGEKKDVWERERTDDQPVINNQDTKEDNHTPREERPVSGDTAEGNVGYRASSRLQDTELVEGMKSKVKPPYTEFGAIKRDSKTERLLEKWRNQNKELAGKEWDPTSNACSPDKLEPIYPFLDQIDTEAISPEELEAIRLRMSGAWSMSEEPKRHSQAPHLKWAKNVVCEILGHSEEEVVDEPNAEGQENQGITQSESNKKPEDATEGTVDLPVITLRKDEESEPELDDEYQLEEFRGMGQSQPSMHAVQVKAMHVTTPTYTHSDTLINTGESADYTVDQNAEPSGQTRLEKSEILKSAEMENEAEAFLNVTNTLYKPNSCPILTYDSESELLSPSREGKSKEGKDAMCQSEDERQGEEPEDSGTSVEIEKMGVGVKVDIKEGETATVKKMATLTNSCSFRDLGLEARFRRRGIRKTTERRNGELVEVQEEEGVGRDRRPIIYSATDDEDFAGRSWGDAELRNGLSIENRKRNSNFFPDTQLYQQYSEAAQNFEILRQSRSDALSVSEESTHSPAPSPPPARRPLPPLPAVPHPHSLSHTGSITSFSSLQIPEPPKNEGRPSSPRLSISLSQSPSLWRELPAVRNSIELEELGEAKRRLQEVRFEVVTSEASYCRSLDIVVEHFVKSKQLGALLGTQDKNWLFSRLTDVRAISHSFLSKLEERVESDVMHFTVCDIIARHCHRFRTVYVPYLTNQSYQDDTYQRLMNDNPRFKRTVENLEKSPVCQRLPLRSFLVLPFQRITRIKLLVQNIVKRTTPDTPEWKQAIKALKLLENLIQESNDSISQMKSIESLVTLSAKVEFECRTLPLISQFRRLVREGPVTELMEFSQKETERKVYLHLFNDNLLLSLPKEGGRFTVIDHCPVSDLRAENCRVKLLSLQKNLFRLHMSQRLLLLRAETQSDKLRWISALSRPHPKTDFSAAEEFEQMQCIRGFVGQQPDELSLDKADIILVHPDSAKCDDWVEGTKLSDRQRGWVPRPHLEIISNAKVKKHNLSDALKLTTATAAV
ncbi:uncharacterized protein arhgef5 isoform X3 [Melanotaenia boesemani]|uniref:uncharacterized protein arhgef5 isoform X3 n=1 Tax=Melanotaenia boesemani TaxID=1250792 RepID=UPI001C03F2B8|nr:uncharacterized protein arhgef5 isoform X3 [Melanotaenia boesemani]